MTKYKGFTVQKQYGPLGDPLYFVFKFGRILGDFKTAPAAKRFITTQLKNLDGSSKSWKKFS